MKLGDIYFVPVPRFRLVIALIVGLALPAPGAAALLLESAWSANPVRPGKPFSLTVTVRWDGEVNRYVVKTPRIEMPEGILKHSVSSRSRAEGGASVLIYHWDLVAEKKGVFPSIPVKLAFLRKGEE